MAPIIKEKSVGYVAGKPQEYQTRVNAAFLKKEAIRNGANPTQAMLVAMNEATKVATGNYADEHTELVDFEE